MRHAYNNSAAVLGQRIDEMTDLNDAIHETLDPDDWESLRKIGHAMVDDLVCWHREIRSAPAWRPMPAAALRHLEEEFPEMGIGIEASYEHFLQHIRPFPLGNIHPRAWGWVNGTGTTVGAFSELLSAGMNTNAWGGHQASTVVEEQVIRWVKRVMDFPCQSSGLLVSGGSTANLVGLAVARDCAGSDTVDSGLRGQGKQLVAYASEQVHNSVDKAVGLLGVGRRFLRKIRTDSSYAMDVDALREAIRRDRGAGHHPFCVIGTAGTVNTGAVDPLCQIAEACRDEDIWLHVDGAFGAAVVLAPSLRDQIRGIEQADSVAFDFHKWLHVPYGVGCVLVRNAEDHRRSFSSTAPYLEPLNRGITGWKQNFALLGPELSRPFRALKVWFALSVYGTAIYGRLVEKNVRQAARLAEIIRVRDDLELMAPVPMNIVCFRYCRRGMDESELNELNREILMQLQETGVAAPSSTVLGDCFAIRVAITNHRSSTSDLQTLVDEVLRLGASLRPAI